MSHKNIFDNSGSVKSYDESIKPLDINSFDIDTQELYFKAIQNEEYKEIINDLINPSVKKIEERQERKIPQYRGLDDVYPNGRPIQPKILNILKRILSGDVYVVNFEGGVRGGKDLWAIYMWTLYLMVCPETMHLVLGKSLEHALINVLHSNGFGLLYTIPNGIFERTSDKGAQRGVFKFTDAYGKNKEIYFYGNDKENDHEKFQGFTIGSTYVVEGMTQHINGLNQSKKRMASTRQHLMILTQNPKGEASKFYTEFEKPLLYTVEQIEMIEFFRDNYKQDFEILENMIVKGFDIKQEELPQYRELYYNKFVKDDGDEKLFKSKFIHTKPKNEMIHIYSDMELNADKVRKAFYKKYQVPLDRNGYSFLNENQKNELRLLLYNNNLAYDSIIRSYTIGDFQKDLDSKHPFYTVSMKKVMSYYRGGENPNAINNAIDYEYFHFTVEDNLGMDEMQREEFRRQFARGSASYDRDILGIRRTTDGAVFPMFNDNNIIPLNEQGNIQHTIMEFEKENPHLFRVIGIDAGFNHPTGIIDCEVDLSNGVVYQLQELLLELKGHDEKGLEYIFNKYEAMVRSRKRDKNGQWKQPDFVIIDPSATATIRYFRGKGVVVKEASNKVFQAKGKSKTHSIDSEAKTTIGIDLMQTAMLKGKYKVGIWNRKTIAQVGSYESYVNTKTGKSEIFKVNDDLVDPIRYIFNTLIKPIMWERDENEYDNTDGKTRQQAKHDASAKIQKYLNEETERSSFDRSRYFGGGGFFS